MNMLKINAYAIPGIVAAGAFIWLGVDSLVGDRRSKTARRLALLMFLLALYSLTETLGHTARSPASARFWFPVADLQMRLIAVLFFEFLVSTIVRDSPKKVLGVTRILLYGLTAATAVAVILRGLGVVSDAWLIPNLMHSDDLYWQGPGPLGDTVPLYLAIGSYTLTRLWTYNRRHGEPANYASLPLVGGALMMLAIAVYLWVVQHYGNGMVAGLPLVFVSDSMLVLMAVATSAGLRRQALVDLRTERDTSSAVLEAMGDGLLLLDTAGTIQLANRRVAEMSGCSADELVGMHAADLFHPEEAGLLKAQIADPTLCDIGSSKQRRLRRKGGTYIPVVVGSTPRFHEDGQCRDFILVITDVREMAETSRELRRRTKEISALHDIAAAAGQSLDMEGILSSTLDLVMQAMRMDLGRAYALDEDTGVLKLAAERGAPREGATETSDWPAGQGRPDELVLGRKPILHGDLSKAASPDRSSICGWSTGASVTIPLVSKDRVLGALCVAGHTPRSLDDDDRRLAEAVSAEVGISVENAMLFQEAGRRGAELVTLHQIGQLVEATPMDDETYRQVARKCVDEFDIDLCVLSIAQDESTHRSIAYCRRGPEKRRVSALLKADKLDLKSGPVGHALLAGRAFVSNRGEGTQSMRPELAALLEGKCWMVVPIRNPETHLGSILLAGSGAPRRFGSRDTFILQEVANLLARAVERSRLFAELEESEAKYRSLVEEASDGVFLCDRRGAFIFANRRMAQITGRSCEELMGKPAHMIFDPETGGRMTETIVQVATSPQLTKIVDGAVTHRSGRRVLVQVGLTGLEYVDGIFAVQGMMRDLSHELEAEQMKSDLVSMVSHELRSPLTLIAGYSAMLQRPEIASDKTKRSQALRAVEDQVKRMLELIEDLLLASRIEHGSIDIRKQPVDIPALAAKFARAYATSSDKHRIRCRFGDEFPVVLADQAGMEQALANLISNAVKYSPDGGEVLMEGAVVDDSVRISVSDEGVGIDPREQDKIFARFYQADMTSTRRYEGIGLGLFLTKTIVEAHGGTIDVESEVGRGSKFTLTLPLDGAGKEPAKPARGRVKRSKKS